MRTRRRLALLSLSTLAFVIGCGGDSSGPPAVASVDVTASSTAIQVGQATSLSATARDAKGNALTGRTVSWSSSNTSIATVSSAGSVTGVAIGSATITATVGGKTGTINVNVVPPPVATVTVTAATTTIQVGQTSQATAVLKDANNNVLTGRAIVWGTSNPSVATVSNTGVITGLTGGTTTITATSENQSGSVQITVTAGNPADAPQISAITPSQLVEGQTATITGTKFGATTDANVVRVGGVPASVTQASPTSLQIIVPKLNCKPAGNVTVDVTVAGLTSAAKSQAFTPGASFTLAVGQQSLITSPSDFCLQFGATNATEKYLIGVQSVTEIVTSVTPATVTAEVPAGGLVASRAPQIATGPVFSASLIDPVVEARATRLAEHHAVEAALLQQDRAMFAGRLRTMRSTSLARRPSLAMIPTVPPSAKVGDVLNIRIPDRARNICQNSLPLAVTVKAIGAHAIIVEDNANPTGGFTATDYQTFSDRFDSQIYATDIAYFGEVTDFDNNSRIVIVITKEVNKIDGLLGEVFPQDLVPQSICAASNEGEFFYGRAPDPSGTAGKAYTTANALNDAPIIIAHEFAHVIQFGRRIASPTATDFQSTWEAEGQATFAEEVNGYTATGLAPGRNLGYDVAFNTPATQPISWFVDPFVDLAIYYGFLSRTSQVVGAPEQCSWLATRSQGNTGPCQTGREVYGVPWSILRYLSDQYGSRFPDGEKGLQRALIDNDFSGFATITSVIGEPIDVLLARWAATLYTDDRVQGIDPKLTLPSWNLVSIEANLVATARLTPRDRQFASFTDNVSVRGGSTAYFVVSGAGRSPTAIRVRNASDGPLPNIMRMWVVRMQ